MTNLKIKEMTDTKNMVDFIVNDKKYCVMKDYLKWALSELKRWQYSGGSNFTLKLFDLIIKADDNNKQRFLLGFPAEMCAYLMWYHKESFGVKYEFDEDFFEQTAKRLESD